KEVAGADESARVFLSLLKFLCLRLAMQFLIRLKTLQRNCSVAWLVFARKWSQRTGFCACNLL
ncbi:hypothetical protein N9Y64_05710, partial [Alphaproteobacteria bacterium]|nr:hypothetical protein [Alphaproteobacteria bacterium]